MKKSVTYAHYPCYVICILTGQQDLQQFQESQVFISWNKNFAVVASHTKFINILTKTWRLSIKQRTRKATIQDRTFCDAWIVVQEFFMVLFFQGGVMRKWPAILGQIICESFVYKIIMQTVIRVFFIWLMPWHFL